MKILGIKIPNFLSHKKEKYTVFYPRININLKKVLKDGKDRDLYK